MQISGTPPMHIARAYQMQQMQVARPASSPMAKPAAPAPAPTTAGRTDSITFSKPANAPTSVSQASHIGTVNPPHEATFSQHMHEVIAGRVSRAIDFDQQSTNQPAAKAHSGDALPMYTRAADRIEAGTAVHVGRSVDFRA